MRFRLAVMALALTSGAAFADDIDIQVDNFTADRGISELVLRVTNNTSKPVSDVFIDCTFMTEEERAIDIGKALISSIPAKGFVFDKAAIPTTDGVAKALCRVVSHR
jgi:hypothetical protein